ncbi:mediator of RNA polymerase II transcription subunit 10 [Diutina catenulata]
MTTATIDGSHRPLQETAEKISGMIDSLIQLGVLVHDNQGTPQSHSTLLNTTNQVVSNLEELWSQKGLDDYPVPIDVISYIEDGRNPDIYTREFIEVTAKSNARLKGKMEGFAKLRDVLGEKLAEEFPHLKDSIKDIVKRTSP